MPSKTPADKNICRVLMIDKERGISSKDVSRRLEKILGRSVKMGHCGTLDPMASGVLPIVLGKATKIQSYLSASHKTYEFTVELGSATDTLDADGEVVGKQEVVPVELAKLEAILSATEGTSMQTPPIYSAKKFKGKPIYWYARNGRIDEVDMSKYTREIEVKELRLLELTPHSIRCSARVSTGTYIRVLGEQIAKASGNLGHLSFLRRTECAGMPVENCLKSSLLEEMSSDEVLASSICPTKLNLKKLEVMQGFDKEVQTTLLHGRCVPLLPTYLQQGQHSICLDNTASSGKTTPREWMLVGDDGKPFGLGIIQTAQRDGQNVANTVKLFRGF
jgi:tRNA pseudouridine55 synthase